MLYYFIYGDNTLKNNYEGEGYYRNYIFGGGTKIRPRRHLLFWYSEVMHMIDDWI